MPRVRERRLARAAAGINTPDAAAAWAATALRARVKLGAVLRQTLAQSGIDPAAVAMLRRCDEAEQQLAAIAHDRQIEAAPAAGAGEPQEEPVLALLYARLDVMARDYRSGRELDLARASLAEILAWCGARGR
jgi:hypothetical protein